MAGTDIDLNSCSIYTIEIKLWGFDFPLNIIETLSVGRSPLLQKKSEKDLAFSVSVSMKT